MLSEIDQLKSDLKESQALVEALEANVADLEAEGLKPLVDRLRLQISATRELLAAMAVAVAKLTGDELGKEAIEEAVEALTE